MRSNSENPGAGAAFQEAVAERFQRDYGMEFILEKRIPIGNPPKDALIESVVVIALNKRRVFACHSY